jgi:hypothetical protein
MRTQFHSTSIPSAWSNLRYTFLTDLRPSTGAYRLNRPVGSTFSRTSNTSSLDAAAMASCWLLPLLQMTWGAVARAGHADQASTHVDPADLAPPSPISSSPA